MISILIPKPFAWTETIHAGVEQEGSSSVPPHNTTRRKEKKRLAGERTVPTTADNSRTLTISSVSLDSTRSLVLRPFALVSCQRCVQRLTTYPLCREIITGVYNIHL